MRGYNESMRILHIFDRGLGGYMGAYGEISTGFALIHSCYLTAQETLRNFNIKYLHFLFPFAIVLNMY